MKAANRTFNRTISGANLSANLPGSCSDNRTSTVKDTEYNFVINPSVNRAAGLLKAGKNISFAGADDLEGKGISVLIGADSESKIARSLLASLASQSAYPGYIEVIAISDKNRPDMAHKFHELARESGYKVKIVGQAVSGAGERLNALLQCSTKEYFTIVRAKDALQKDFLVSALEAASQDAIAFLPVIERRAGALSFSAETRSLIQTMQNMQAERLLPYFASMNGVAAPRSALSGSLVWEAINLLGEAGLGLFLSSCGLKLKSAYSPGIANAYICGSGPNLPDVNKSVDPALERIDFLISFMPKNLAQKRLLDSLIKRAGRMLIESQKDASSLAAIERELFEERNHLALLECSPTAKSGFMKEASMNEGMKRRYWLARLADLDTELPLQASMPEKREKLHEIREAESEILNELSGMPEEDGAALRKAICASPFAFVNKSKFGSVKGIAYCHNFSPAADPAAYLSVKRLGQISKLWGETINWTCVYCDKIERKKDTLFHDFYARQQATEIIPIGGQGTWDDEKQIEWGKDAYCATRDIRAKVIYSHVYWIASHLAAMRYKLAHPEVYWYAEFSDPVYIWRDCSPRPSRLDTRREYGGSFNAWLEAETMRLADYVIFTNKNQKDLIIRRNPLIKDKKEIQNKSHSVIFPVLPKQIRDLAISDFKVEDSYLNIAYFGSLYPGRQLKELIDIIKKYDRVKVYYFALLWSPLSIPEQIRDRVVKCPTVSHLEFFAISKKMDLLYLEDIDFKGDINPYLPSKFIDYLQTGTRMLVKIQPGSPLSRLSHKSMVKVEDFDSIYKEWLARKSGALVESSHRLSRKPKMKAMARARAAGCRHLALRRDIKSIAAQSENQCR